MNAPQFPDPSARLTPQASPHTAAPSAAASLAGAQAQVEGLPAVLWRRRWTIVALTFAGIAGAMVYLWNATPLYRSDSQIYVQREAPRILDESGHGYGSEYLHTQARVIRSTAVLANAVESPHAQQAVTLETAANPVGRLRSGLDVEVDRHGEIMTVGMTSTDPNDAAVLVNAVVEAYIDYQDQRQRSTAADVLSILREEKEKAEAQHRDLSQRMLAFQREHGTLSFESAEGNIVVNRLGRLSRQLTEAETRSRELRLLWSLAQEATERPRQLQMLIAGSMDELNAAGLAGADGDGGGHAQRLAAQLSELRWQLTLHEAEYGQRHRTTRQLRRQMHLLQNRYAEHLQHADAQPEAMSDRDRYLLMLRQQVQMAERQAADIREAYEQQKAEAMELNAKAAEYRQMQTEMSRVERLLDTLDNRIRQVNVTEDTGMLNISILEPARAGSSPVHPVPSRILAMGLLTGLLLGCGGAMLQEWADQRIRSTEEAALLLQSPVLGVIPHEQLSRSRSARARTLAENPRSDVSEAFRTLRTAVYFGSSDGCPRTLLVTSPAPEEGKTTLSANLAIAFAQTGARVLLIDADCRRPMQHEIFERHDGVGLSSVVMGHATFDQAVQATESEQLDLLACGPVPSNPSEMLNSQAFQDLLAAARQRYDQVILDAPPVGPVTDARIIAAAVDATLLVLRAERSARRPLVHARDALQGVGARIIGAAINDVPRGGGRYGYYGYYAYGRYGQYGHYDRDRESHNGAAGNGHGGGPGTELEEAAPGGAPPGVGGNESRTG